MPTYNFRCSDCSSIFEEQRTFAQGSDPSPCPTCESLAVGRVYRVPFFAGSGPDFSAWGGGGGGGGGCACANGGTCSCKAGPAHA